MLKQLDTLIGFAVVMSVVSMLIMVATQAISSFLALRGKNLLDGLEALFVTLVPELAAADTENKPTGLGLKLAWRAICNFFFYFFPQKTANDADKAANARALAELILKRPIISDSSLKLTNRWWPERWKLATAIRPEECLRAIKKIAASDEKNLKNVLDSNAQTQVTAAKAAANKVIEALGSSEAKTAADNALIALRALVPDQAIRADAEQKIGALLAHALGGGGPPDGLGWLARFQSVQDRVDQWFTMHARITTVVFAFVAAFVLQLNAFELFTRLANDADLRNQLVNLSPNIQKRVDEALNVKFPGTVYAAALKELKAKGEISTDPSAAPPETNASARQWLIDQKVATPVLTDYDKLVQEKAAARAKDAKEEFKQMVGLYDQTKLQLIPEPYPLISFGDSFPYVHNVRAFLGFTGWRPGKPFWGMFASGMLLSLGAPFWFNLLKSLASLRSTVKDKVDQEQKEKKPS